MINQDECTHDWVYENKMLLTEPPKKNKICSRCGKKETVTLGARSKGPTYEELVEKFSGVEYNNSMAELDVVMPEITKLRELEPLKECCQKVMDSLEFDEKKAMNMSASEVREKYPRGICNVCKTILYKSSAQYIYGDY
jgi:hypothetical protein